MGTLTLYSGVQGGTRFHKPPFFKTKKLGLLGRTENIKFAPWEDPSWTLASHTSARELSKREPDWYFDLHRPACFTQERKSWNPAYYTWLQKLQTPIFMQESGVGPWATIPMAVRFPIERVLQEYDRPYFTNHCAYLIALAMMEGVEVIGLFGCQYGAGTEYTTQRGSLEYWLGRFEQAGGRVVLPIRSNSLLNYPAELYGYESHDEHGRLVGGYKDGEKFKRATAKKTSASVPLTLIDPDETKRPTDLAPPPAGEAIAWDRRKRWFPNQADA